MFVENMKFFFVYSLLYLLIELPDREQNYVIFIIIFEDLTELTLTLKNYFSF